MVDWLTVEVPADLPGPISDGCVAKFRADGSVDWSCPSRLALEGSWSSSVLVRAVTTSSIEVSGNIAKFLSGHNLYGSSCPRELLLRFFERTGEKLWSGVPVCPDVEKAVISRVDVTSGLMLQTPADVLSFIKAADERGHCAYRGRGVLKGEGTLVYGDATGKRAKAWQVTMYAKGLEVAKRHLPKPMMEFPGVLEWVNCLLRVEVRLRTAELKRRGLRLVSDWGDDTCRRSWEHFVGRIDLMDGVVMEGNELVGAKPRLVAFYRAWAAGDDLRQVLNERTFYRLRREMREAFSVDIALKAPRTNVIPLRRVVTAEPAQRPPWADAVDRLLAA